MKPPSIYIVFQRATFRSGLENQHFRILADLAANPINTVLLGHAHFWKNVPKSWKSIENEPILKFPGWDSGVLNPRTIIRLIRPLPTPKSGLKNQKSSKILNIRNPKVYTKFVRQPYRWGLQPLAFSKLYPGSLYFFQCAWLKIQHKHST